MLLIVLTVVQKSRSDLPRSVWKEQRKGLHSLLNSSADVGVIIKEMLYFDETLWLVRLLPLATLALVRLLLGHGGGKTAMLSYCPNRDCPDRSWRYNAVFCDRCGTELTPCIDCRCGKSCYNPTDQRYMPRFCLDCGREWTEAYLAECMSAQLKGLVAKVAAQWDALPS